MKQFKSVLFALLVVAGVGVLTTVSAGRSQASIPPISIYPYPFYLPDLVVSEVDPVYTGGTSRYRGALVPDQIWVKVTNQGNGNARAFECFFEWDLGYANEQEFFWLQEGLGAGQSVWVLANANGYNLWAANHQFRFTVNYGHGIVESNYTNDDYDGP